MPMAKTAAATKKLVPNAAESTTATGTRRVRLSKALVAKSAGKSAGMVTPASLPTPNGAKPKTLKLVSDRYKIPNDEYAQLEALKKRLLLLGVGTRKSELLRAGLMLRVAMGDIELTKAVAKLRIIKVARSPKTAN